MFAPSPSTTGWVRATVTLTGRVLRHWRRRPGSIAVGLLFPVLLVLMFGYLFGGAMAVPDGDYMEFLIPGMLTMTMLFGLEAVTIAVTTDTARGVTERIRAMPVRGTAHLAARSTADALNAILGVTVMVTAGLLAGWTAPRGFIPTLAAIGLLLWLRFALSWVGIYLGLFFKTPESAVTVQILVWPLGFLSSAFVSPGTMPGWLGTLSSWNPLSATATATRQLFGNPEWATGGWATDNALTLALVWPAVLTVFFLPLAVRRYHQLSR